MVAAQSAAHRRVVLKRSLGRGLIVFGVVAGPGGWQPVPDHAPWGHPAERAHVDGKAELVQAKRSGSRTFVKLDGEPGGCVGTGEYADIRIGMPITVEDDEGVLIGQAWLDPGEVTTHGPRSSPACSFAFTVDNLAPATNYRIAPGDRDAVDVSLKQLQAAGWEIALTIGSVSGAVDQSVGVVGITAPSQTASDVWYVGWHGEDDRLPHE